MYKVASAAFFTLVCVLSYSLAPAAADAADTSGTTTSSSNRSDQKFEWTLERMMMATAMPMTGKERIFLQTHKNLDGVRSWTFSDFSSYTSSDIGKKHVVEEAAHWQGVVKMLKDEATEQSASLQEAMPDYGPDSPTIESEELQKMLNQASGAEAKRLFEQMKVWRKQISILAPYVETMRKKRTAAI